jgi:hypothetical protein
VTSRRSRAAAASARNLPGPSRHRPARVLPRKGPQRPPTPLTAHTAEVLAAWLAEQHAGTTSPLFATRAGTQLSRDAVEHLVTRHAATAARTCPTLQARRSPRTPCVTPRR